MRLAEGFWNSEYAKLEADEIVAKAGVWASDMSDIPSQAIPELHRRTMAKHGNTWAPTLGDFRASWLDPAWDYWAEVNRSPEADSSPMLALPAPLLDQDGPGSRSFRAQRAHLEKHGYFVCCDCTDAVGFAPTTLLNETGAFWVCAQSQCDFELRQGEAACPPRPRLARDSAAKQSQPTFDPAKHAQLEALRRSADLCQVDLDIMEPSDFVHFRLFVDWFGGRYPTTTLSREMLKETWGCFAQKLEEKRVADASQ